MPAVDAARARGIDGRAKRRVQARVGCDADLVRDRVLWLRDAVREIGRNRRRDVLHQRTAGRDVEYLRSAADREDGEVLLHGPPREVDLEFVSSRLGVLDARMSRFTVECRVYVPTSRQEHAVDRLEDSARTLAHLEHTRPRA
jgi:hypothetical protein